MSHCCSSSPVISWYRKKSFLVALVLAFIAVLSYVEPFLEPFRRHLYFYLDMMGWAVAFGLLLGGAIEHFVPKEYVVKLLSGGRKRTIVSAVTAGFFMSLCSHGILALAIQLYKKGAASSSVVAFLLASPWANLPFTIILFSFFGLKGALYIVCVSLLIAVSTGILFLILEKYGWVEGNPNRIEMVDGFSIFSDLKRRRRDYQFSKTRILGDVYGVWRGAVSLSDMILWWILIGIGLSSLAGAYVPAAFFQDYMGADLKGMLATLGFATVMEICSEGSAPMAFEIFRQTGALGNAFIFLMAGVATDYTEIGLLWSNIGRKTALWLPIVTVPQIILWGLFANLIF